MMKSLKNLLWYVKRFLGIQLNMEKIKKYIKEQIMSQTPAFEVEFFTINSPKKEDYVRTVINCHFQEDEIKLLDLFDQGTLYKVNDIERVKKFLRINAGIVLFISIPFFINQKDHDCLGTSFFLHYPDQGYNHPVRLYSTSMMLDIIGGKNFDNYRKLFPYFNSEGSQIENLFPRFPSKKRLTEDCCD